MKMSTCSALLEVTVPSFFRMQLNLFLTWISVRPSTFYEISCHFGPHYFHRARTKWSSCNFHLSRLTEGLMALIQRSLHWRGVR